MSTTNKITGRVERVTPAMAKRLLENRLQNRVISRSIVNRYRYYIQNGFWKVNGEPIIVSDDDHLMDGQHRLQAIIDSNIAVDAFVIRGIERTAMPSLNTGRKRNLADNLHMLDILNYATISAGVTILYEWSHGFRGAMGVGNRAMRIGYDAIIEYLLTKEIEGETVNEELQRGMPHVYGLRGLVLPSCVISAFAIIARAGGDGRAKNYFHQIKTGAELGEDSPILDLRMFLHPLHGQRPKRGLQFHSILLTWNAMLENKRIDLQAELDSIVSGSKRMAHINETLQAKKYVG
jgi:hypothetical protein